MAVATDCEYLIEIQTGERRFHPLDLKKEFSVKVSLTGSSNKVENIPLKKNLTNKIPFENGNLDKFKFNSPYLGNVQEVTLKCDKTDGLSWYVQTVKISLWSWPASNAPAHNTSDHDVDFKFDVYKWFSNNFGWEHTLKLDFAVKSLVFDEAYKSEHYTHKFKQQSANRIILRKGFSVRFRLTLKRPFEKAIDGDFKIVLRIGENAREGDNTLVLVSNSQTNENYRKNVKEEKWAFEILEVGKDDILVELFIPSPAMVGSYILTIENVGAEIFKYKQEIVVLFNPWCETDECYMPEKREVREYVMRQHGIIFLDNKFNPYPKKWYYGQFEEVSLDVVLYLLNMISVDQRQSIVGISRRFTSFTNSVDNDGIVYGKWEDDFSDGQAPSFWQTSPAILQKYKEEFYQPVRYGQCWVFAGVLTTLMRTLGVPCRPVSNYDSAHDTDANISVDYYIQPNGEQLKDKITDSIWNFHVWNDAWFRRDDLKKLGDFDGWQAIDSTPQEYSGDYAQMGPAPMRAVKHGHVNHLYDSKFVYAEVNGERVWWLVMEGRENTAVFRSTEGVGSLLITKQVGSEVQNDITDEYKFKDGSVLESGVIRKAYGLVENPIVVSDPVELDVEIVPLKNTYNCGESIDLEMKVHNKSQEDKTVSIHIKTELTHYTSTVVADLESKKEELQVTKESVAKISYQIPSNLYIDRMAGDESIEIHMTASIPGTTQIATTHRNIALLKPEITLKIDKGKTFISEQDMHVEISFQNPLDVPLTKCEGYFGGSSLEKPNYDWIIDDIPAMGKFKKTYKVQPMKVGGTNKKRSLMYSFSCKPIGGFGERILIRVSDSYPVTQSSNI